MVLQIYIEKIIAEFNVIPEYRKKKLKLLRKYILEKKGGTNLLFICTHNSRRSLLAQVWAQVAAHHYDFFDVTTYSGGTETTSFYPSAIRALQIQGLLVNKISKNENPIYTVKYSESVHPIICYSKKYNDFFNPKNNFAAIMTCNHADQNCPRIPNSDEIIPIYYKDPKLTDGSQNEQEKYLERSAQICREMFYIFSKAKKQD